MKKTDKNIEEKKEKRERIQWEIILAILLATMFKSLISEKIGFDYSIASHGFDILKFAMSMGMYIGLYIILYFALLNLEKAFIKAFSK